MAQNAAIPGLWWKVLTGIFGVGLIFGAFFGVGPAYGFRLEGHGAKVVFFHVPCAWLATIAYVVAACYAVQFLRRRSGIDRFAGALSDIKCCTAMELGFTFALLTTITGSIFAHQEWGSYWNWDPRETSIVILLLIFAAYLVLRGSVLDPDTRARLSSAYVLVSIVPGLFLLWIVPRIVEQTLHPNTAVVGGGLSAHFRMVLYGLGMPTYILLFVWMFQLKVRLEKVALARTRRALATTEAIPASN